MLTDVYTIETGPSYDEALQRALDTLREGRLVVIPTETVYGLAANALHPGVLATRIWNQNKTPLSLLTAALKPLMGSPDIGGRATARLAADGHLAAVNGTYFNVERQAEPAPDARDADLARCLWETSQELTGVADRFAASAS